MDDALRLGIFLAPWASFATYVIISLALQAGALGSIEGVLLSLAALPFWRCLCARPVFHPFTALLRRYFTKLARPEFEDISDAGLARVPKLAWVHLVESQVEVFRDELRDFLGASNVGDTEEKAKGGEADGQDKWWIAKANEGERNDDGGKYGPSDDDKDGRRVLGEARSSGWGGAGKMTPSQWRRQQQRQRQQRNRLSSQRLLATGSDIVPLCDDTLERPTAVAALHFPRTVAAVASVGGFHAKLWRLAPDKSPPRPVCGLSDGYWRVHVVVSVDEDEVDRSTAGGEEDTLTAASAGLGGRKGGGAGIGIHVNGEDRSMNKAGAVYVVNDFHPRFFYNSYPDGGGGAVVLSFDVVRPEYASSRSSLLQHRTAVLRVFRGSGTGGGTGDGNVGGGGGMWRQLCTSFSLSLLSNLT